MDADHATIAPTIPTVEAAATKYRTDPLAQDDLVASLAALSAPLLDHLRREEDDAMPVVSASISDRDWRAWDQKYNVRGKSLPRLAAEGHWLMDSLDPQRYQILVHLVPAPLRFVVIKGFAGQYRRACARRWAPTSRSCHSQRSHHQLPERAIPVCGGRLAAPAERTDE
jgi:hypothetical protein